MGKGDPTYKSSIENINNNTILVTNSVSDNTCYCFFYCFNARNTRTINGRLVYDRSDSAKAETVLTDLLNGIKFKD